MPDVFMDQMCQTELRQLFGRYGPRLVHKQMQALYEEWKSVLLPEPEFNPPQKEIHVQLENVLETPTVVWERERVGTFDAKTGVRIPKPIVVESDAKQSDAAVKKATHKQAIADKRAELESKQVDPLSLLTEQNLKEWLLGGVSFAQIAEQTGNDDSVVSVTAKRYGLESKIQKLIRAKRSLKQSGL